MASRCNYVQSGTVMAIGAGLSMIAGPHVSAWLGVAGSLRSLTGHFNFKFFNLSSIHVILS